MRCSSPAYSLAMIRVCAAARFMYRSRLAGYATAVFLAVVAATVCNLAEAQTTAPNEWTLVATSGSIGTTSPKGPPGVYGTLGTAAAGNKPGGRDSAATWTDNSGNFWLFGGEGFDVNGNFGQLNDLWEFQPSTKEWTWMGGSSSVPAICAGSATIACGQPGVYGTLGSAATANVPGGRSNASHWTDSYGNFWLFGGYGFDAGRNLGELNDLWEFNSTTRQWTWIGGSSTVGSNGGQPGVYGDLGSAAAANIPSGRDSAASWVDNKGQFWLYGGEGFDNQGNYGQLDDLWKFDPNAQEWTWIGGSSTVPASCTNRADYGGQCGWPAHYGTQGVPADGTSPGSRVGALGWTDKDGNIWLFGGIGDVLGGWDFNFSFVDQYDLWEFNANTQQWTWMSGNSSLICGTSSSEDWCGQNGIYGTEGIPAIANIPPSRNNATHWVDSDGNFWLFGGAQPWTTNVYGAALCNDVWIFEPTANEWAWMNGEAQFGMDSCTFTYGNDAVPGTPAATNTPSGRLGAATWTDLSGNLWVFGGYGDGWFNGSTNGTPLDINDLWVYEPVAPAPTPSFELVASPNPINIAAMGTGTSPITSGTTTVHILVADGFSSPVTLTATSGLTGIVGSFSPATITGTGSSTLTISVTGAAVGIAESIPLTVTATGGGMSQSIQVIVAVTDIGQLAAPSFSVPSGTYSTPQTVTISDSGCMFFNTVDCVYYTIDGTTPTQSSPVYAAPIPISSTTTLKAVGIYSNNQSAVSSATYTVISVAATPDFSPADGTYSSAQSVTLTDSTPGATIYYTTNGTTPTASSTAYKGPITVSSTETIEAIAIASGFGNSAVGSATYTINTPTFTFAASPTSLTVNSGSQGSATMTVTPQNGFNSAVSFACSGLPANATCSFNPTTVTPSGTAANAQLTITVSAQASATRSGSRPFLPATGLAIAGCFFVWKRRRLLGGAVVVVLLLVGAGLFSGCGGGGTASGGGGGGGSPQSYTVNVTATSGTIQQTTAVTLTEN